MKNLIAIVLAALMLIGLSACNGKEKPNGAPELINKPVPPAADKAAKPLVVYFSCTGNTKRVAEIIAKTTGGDLFEITPKEPYTDADLNWRDKESRVSREFANKEKINVPLAEQEVPGWADRDTVFIGYPIWYGEAAFPVTAFVKANDFEGRTVIPFCTSTHVGLGRSAELLKDAAGGRGTWKEGVRFEEQPEESEVADWARSVVK